jgi:8-oxo-dGTP pyrophosphatase MutT (NUDIX family)
MALFDQLQSYIPHDSTESAHLEKTLNFLQQIPEPFHRETLVGHITGSAIVVNPTYCHILLLHHRQLDRWLQPGGHCDGDRDTLAVAMREVQEETGLVTAKPVDRAVFDIDVHPIPTKKQVPKHWHYDIRYLLVADDREVLQKAEREAIALKWIPFSQLTQLTTDESLHRVLEKLYRIASIKI